MPEALYSREYAETERHAQLNTQRIVADLTARAYSFQWVPPAMMRLDAKLHNYLSHHARDPEHLSPLPDSSTIADALAELSPKSLAKWLANPRQTLAERIRLHNAHSRRAAEMLQKKLRNAPPSVPAIHETTSADGKYYLVKLFTEKHFKDVSATLEHCLGTDSLKHYRRLEQAGDIEIFSLREIVTNKAVATIEYRTKDNAITQIKTNHTRPNELVERGDPYFQATIDAIKYLRDGTGYDEQGIPIRRGVRSIGDVERMVPPNHVLLSDGKILSLRDALELGPDDVLTINGELIATASLPAVKLARFCAHCPAACDFTNATYEQREALQTVKGSLRDQATMLAYPNLEIVGGDLLMNKVDAISLPRLRKIGRTFCAAAAIRLSLPELHSVGGELDTPSATKLNLTTLHVIGASLRAPCAAKLTLPELRSVGGDVNVASARSLQFPKLRSIGGILHASSVRALNFPELHTVGDSIYAGAAAQIVCQKLTHTARIRTKARHVSLGSNNIRVY